MIDFTRATELTPEVEGVRVGTTTFPVDRGPKTNDVQQTIRERWKF